MFDQAGVPEMPAALCHFDWHLGNALCDAAGTIQAVIDWEFAGIADPRLDLARYCRRERWTGDVVCRDKGSDRNTAEIWESYARARFGDAADVRRLGPLDPWMAFESLIVFVIGSVVCHRVALQQAGVPDVSVPRCDLLEWGEDMETARWHLQRMGLVPASAQS
eukprot:SRR837773.20722.p2 GENE.SRR837773.20722~~SRR837773.20722.p2  ORF type:complete len:177 (+),score=17.34 SRR837773.20722:41-532(+)